MTTDNFIVLGVNDELHECFFVLPAKVNFIGVNEDVDVTCVPSAMACSSVKPMHATGGWQNTAQGTFS